MSDRSLAARKRMQKLHIEKMKIGKNTLIKATDNQGKVQLELRGREYSQFEQNTNVLTPGTQLVALNDTNLRQWATAIQAQMGPGIDVDSILDSLKLATDEYKKYGDPSKDSESNNRRLIVGNNGEIIEMNELDYQ